MLPIPQHSPTFSPPLSLSTLSLTNLTSLSFTHFTPSNPAKPFPPSRYLYHALGRPALPIAALAHLSTTLPAALPALLPPAKPSLPPTLYVFGHPSTLSDACALLAPSFVATKIKQWNCNAPDDVNRALCEAVRRAVVEALVEAGGVVIGAGVVMVDEGLVYSVKTSRRPGGDNVNIRIGVKKCALRHVEEADINGAAGLVNVVAGPVGLRGVLSERGGAGDALTESVLGRWREGGLLRGPGEEGVVFVKISGGVEVPFPREVLLIDGAEGVVSSGEKKKGRAKNGESKGGRKVGTGLGGNAGGSVRSRKRPRSPTGERLADKGAAKEKKIGSGRDGKSVAGAAEKDVLQVVMERFAADAPTARSINEALEKAKEGGIVDAVPVLLHPVADDIVPPGFVEGVVAEGEGEIRKDVEKMGAVGQVNKPEIMKIGGVGNMGGTGVAGTSIEVKVSPPVISPKVEPKRSESSEGIDAFLLDGVTGGAQNSFDNVGPSMDMTDFTAFDDDVTEFFRDGMDDRLSTADGGLGGGEEVTTDVQQVQGQALTSGAYRVSEQEAGFSHSNLDCKKESQMDVDTDLDEGTAANDVDVANRSLRTDGNSEYARNVMAMALSSLREPTIVPRPDEMSLGSRLSSFFEDDLTDRRLVSLGASGSIGKRYSRSSSKAKTKRSTIVRVKDDSWRRRGKPRSDAISYALSPHFSYRFRSGNVQGNKNNIGFYVPRRKVKAFTKMRQSGAHVTGKVLLAKFESESESEYGDDEDDEEQIPLPITKDPIQGERTWPLEIETALKDDDHVVFDPLKIVDSVAVDCASACMVLAASRFCQYSPPQGSCSSISSASGEVNGTQLSHREEDPGKGGGAGIVHTDVKAHTVSMNTKSHGFGHSGSPASRSVQIAKRERELMSMLTLLEMQSFSVKELDLLCETTILSDSAKFALSFHNAKRGQQESVADSVSPATVRRVLLGLPRLLETSRVFGSCAASMREHDDGAQLLKVLGPVPIGDILGENTSLFPLNLPRVCVGFKNEWIETSSDVLPLWEKTGLEPYSERKDVNYVAVAPKEMEFDVKLFLRDLSASYEECSFGKHSQLPFDEITLISNSTGRTDRNRVKNPDLLSESDKAMAEQYYLAITGLCTKLTSVTRGHRKNPNVLSMNIVVYIVSPFENSETAANVALLKAISPLVSSIPGAVPSMVPMLGPASAGMALPSAPWRCPPSSKNVVSITVRILPKEIVDRQLSGHAEIEYLLERPLRPQLVKAVSFSVFSSIRSKRVRSSPVDGEVAGMLARASLMPDDLMSPMTPDIVAESPGGSTGTPVSPKGTTNDDGAGSPSAVVHGGAYVDQGSALSPSFLHEPAIVLSGVGTHIGQTDAKASIVLHLSYSYCESSARYAFVWTDQRGEALDIATVPVSKMALAASRRKAFWCMWTRGQRWKISYVRDVHTTIAKLGLMQPEEVRDWDWVIAKVMQAETSSTEKRIDDTPGFNVVRRFPPVEQASVDEIHDLYTDQPTPATPGNSQPTTNGNNTKIPVSMDIKLPAVSSVTILDVTKTEEHSLMEVAESSDNGSQRDFAVISESSLSERSDSQACAIIASFEDKDIAAIELNVLRHYGKERGLEDMNDDGSPWDAHSVQAITSSIALNFHELRYVGAPPSWPCERWQGIYPVHLDIVRRFQKQMAEVTRFAFSSSAVTQK